MFDPEENIVRASIVMEEEEAMRKASEAMDSAGPETATQRTFDPANMLKRELLPKCIKAGIPDIQNKMSLAEIKDVVRKFFIELHHSECTTLQESDCYIAKKTMERKGKGSRLQHKRGRVNLQLRSLKWEIH
jgi:hypothetical protein